MESEWDKKMEGLDAAKKKWMNLYCKEGPD